MSFDATHVLGLVQMVQWAQYADSRSAEEFASGTTVLCVPPPPLGPYSLRTSAASDVDWSADPADIELHGTVDDPFTDLTFAPYYALAVRFTRPHDFGTWTDPQACHPGPPYDITTVSPTIYGELAAPADILDGVGAAAPTTALAEGAAPWLITGYLVNPAPVWPSPDAEGNTFGRVLWTAEQIPTITGVVSVESGPTIDAVEPGVLEVYVMPYRLAGEEPPTSVPHQYIIGSA